MKNAADAFTANERYMIALGALEEAFARGAGPDEIAQLEDELTAAENAGRVVAA